MAENLSAEEIINKANEPKSVNIDGQKVDQRSVDELIKSDRYAAMKTARASKKLGVRFVNHSFPGSV